MMGQRFIYIALLLLGLVDGVRGQDAVAQRQDAPVHIVVRGETLSHIARARGTTVDELKRLNGLSGDLIRIGQVLLLQSGVRAAVAGLDNPASGSIDAAGHETTGITTLYIPAAMKDALVTADVAGAPRARRSTTAFETPDARETTDARETADARERAGAREPAESRETAQARESADARETAEARDAADAPKGTDARASGETAGVLEADDTRTSGEASQMTDTRIADDALEATVGAPEQTPGAGADVDADLSAAAMTFAAGGVSAYVVEEEGETLYGIADSLGTKAYILYALNDGIRAPLEPGTVLVIPASASQAAWTSSAAAGGDLMQGGAPPFAVGSVTVLPETYAGSVMASGRVYEPAAFVVAHRELPFDTILIVENERTGRASFARVADRHPREEGVLLAISPALASEIDVESGEMVRVRLVE